MSEPFKLSKRPATDNIFAGLGRKTEHLESVNVELQFEGRTYRGTVYDIDVLVDNEQAVRWQCNKYGSWVCACYFVERALKFAKTKPERYPVLADYWRINE